MWFSLEVDTVLDRTLVAQSTEWPPVDVSLDPLPKDASCIYLA
jgi:hypothetical protein